MSNKKLEEIKNLLKEVQEGYPNLVISELKKGSIVERSWGLSYEIDDPEIHKRLGNYNPGQIPLTKIYRSLKGEKEEIIKLFGNRKIIPFSEAFNEGLGVCLEKSILVQLFAQKARDSFIINGLLELKGDAGPLHYHGYNVVFKDKVPHIVDSSNPLDKDKEGVIPYTAPITGFDFEKREFEVEEKWRQGRTYLI